MLAGVQEDTRIKKRDSFIRAESVRNSMQTQFCKKLKTSLRRNIMQLLLYTKKIVSCLIWHFLADYDAMLH